MSQMATGFIVLCVRQLHEIMGAVTTLLLASLAAGVLYPIRIPTGKGPSTQGPNLIYHDQEC